MGARKLIRIVLKGQPDEKAVHRFRNLGEDLLRCIEQKGLGSLGGHEIVDSATVELEIHVPRTRDVGTVRQLVREQVKRHNLTDQTIIWVE